MPAKEDSLSFLRRYGVPSAVVFSSIIITAQLPPLSQATGLFVILAAIVFGAWYGGLGPGLFTTALSTVIIAYSLVAPTNSFALHSKEDGFRLLLFAVISSAVVSFASSRKVLEDRLGRSNEELRRLTAHIEMVKEEERKRLAREIHDELGGMLSSLKLDVASIQKYLKGDKTIQNKTEDILKEIDGAILTVQRIATELRPSLLDDFGLAAAIATYLDIHCRKGEFDCETDIDPKVDAQGPLGTAIFRVFQEAFTNVLRHARATEVLVQLKQDKTGIRLVVTDNGMGIRPEQMHSRDSLGLIGMHERIRQFGGTFTVVGRPGEGTTVTVVVPPHAGC